MPIATAQALAPEHRFEMSDHRLFESTAPFYARYRPGYPPELFDMLEERFSLTPAARAMDLGCGTGQLALYLSPLCGEVLAVDPEPEMLEEAKRLARNARRENIRFCEGSSQNLDAFPGPWQLVAMGRSFHWMDRQATLARLYDMVAPGGGVAIISDYRDRDTAAPEWLKAADDIVTRHTGHTMPGKPPEIANQNRKTGPRHEAFLDASRFTPGARWEMELTRIWDIDEIVGFCFSLSTCSPAVLGKARDAFENDLREALAEAEETCGPMRETITLEALTGFKA